jgi:uncharacterized iron-regulated membrane protein
MSAPPLSETNALITATATANPRWRIDRSLLVLVHRYVGLVMAGFLLLAGLTGSLLAWNHELEALAAPSLWRIAVPPSKAPMIDALQLRDHVQALHPDTFVARAPLKVRPGAPLVFRLYALPDPDPDPATGAVPELANDEVFVDPHTGQVLGRRKWGDITQGAKNLMPFIYRLHHTLLLGDVGSYVLGVVALLWTIDCFVGAWLTFPARRRADSAQLPQQKSWLSRWRPAWRLRWRGSGAYRRHLGVHRVAGLWPWAMLFVIAWSAVAFNLAEVHDPVMQAVFSHQADDEPPMLDVPVLAPALDWQAARQHARALMASEARQRGFEVLEEDALTYDPRNGIYSYRVRSTRDVASRWGITQLSFDGGSGALRRVWLPTGAASGDTIRTWMTTLHMAGLWGMPTQILACLLGMAVAALSLTGAVLWWKKREGRLKLAARRLKQA